MLTAIAPRNHKSATTIQPAVRRHHASNLSNRKRVELREADLQKRETHYSRIMLKCLMMNNKELPHINGIRKIVQLKSIFQTIYSYLTISSLNPRLELFGLKPLSKQSGTINLTQRLRRVEILLETTDFHDFDRDHLTSLAKDLVSLGAMREDKARESLTKAGLPIPKDQSVARYLNTLNIYSETPVTCAARIKDADSVQALIKAGADLNIQDEDGETPLHKAAYRGHTGIAKALIAAGADATKANDYGDTPLYYAAQSGMPKIVQALIDAGADPKEKDYDHTSLHIAACHGYTEIAKVLIKAGAEINKAHKYGNTPLQLAASNGHTDIVKSLLAKGADVNLKNNDGYTSLQNAERKGHTDIVDLITAHQAPPSKRKRNEKAPGNPAKRR